MMVNDFADDVTEISDQAWKRDIVWKCDVHECLKIPTC